MSDMTPTPRTDRTENQSLHNLSRQLERELSCANERIKAQDSEIESRIVQYTKHVVETDKELAASRELCRQFKEVAGELRENGIPLPYSIGGIDYPKMWNAAKAKLEALNQTSNE